MQTEVYKLLIGQIIRFVLNLSSGVLMSIGVERGVFDSAVNAAVPILAAAVLAGIAFIYGYLEKKAQVAFHLDMVEAAFLANPADTTLPQVAKSVIAKQNPV